MFADLVSTITSFLFSLPGMIVIGLVVLVVLYKMFKGKGTEAKGLGRDTDVDISTLGKGGPPAKGPVLECRHVPVRLALVVLAPVGRAGALSAGAGFNNIVDQITPGLGKVNAAHKPLVKLWPAQLSHTGFASLFFKSCKLPGDAGRATPWCSLAGMCEIDGKNVNVGLVMCAAEPNNLSQHTVETSHKWRDELRVKDA